MLIGTHCLIFHNWHGSSYLLELTDEWTWSISLVIILRYCIPWEVLLVAEFLFHLRWYWRREVSYRLLLFPGWIDRCDLSWWLVFGLGALLHIFLIWVQTWSALQAMSILILNRIVGNQVIRDNNLTLWPTLILQITERILDPCLAITLIQTMTVIVVLLLLLLLATDIVFQHKTIKLLWWWWRRDCLPWRINLLLLDILILLCRFSSDNRASIGVFLSLYWCKFQLSLLLLRHSVLLLWLLIQDP